MTRYIVSYPNILDGEPVIIGTRIPVVEFLLLLKEGYTLLEIQKMYPHVEPHTFERVLEEVAAGSPQDPPSMPRKHHWYKLLFDEGLPLPVSPAFVRTIVGTFSPCTS